MQPGGQPPGAHHPDALEAGRRLRAAGGHDRQEAGLLELRQPPAHVRHAGVRGRRDPLELGPASSMKLPDGTSRAGAH